MFIVSPHSLQWALPNGQRVDIHGFAIVGRVEGKNREFLVNHQIKAFQKVNNTLIILN